MSMNEKINFFNRHAIYWDSYLTVNDYQKIEAIIERSKIQLNDKILDVACGTGIFTDVLIKKNYKHIQAIDFSDKMVEIYQKKFPHLTVINNNFEDLMYKEKSFDHVIIFNSFPHFNNYDKVFENSYKILKNRGKLTIAHSMNREELDKHHSECENAVKDDILISDDSICQLYKKYNFQNICIGNQEYFYSSGKKLCK